MKEQIKITILEKEAKPSPFAENLLHNEYKLKLSYKDETFEFTYHDSVYNYEKKIELDMDDALYSLISDAQAYAGVESVEKFLDYYGYAFDCVYEDFINGCTADMTDEQIENIRKGLKAYTECQRTYNAFENMFNSDELTELTEEFADY